MKSYVNWFITVVFDSFFCHISLHPTSK